MEMSAPKTTTSKAIKPRSVSVLGSTGSIGCNTLDLIGRNLEQFSVVALTGNRNVQLLAEQARIFRPELVVVAAESSYIDLKKELSGILAEHTGQNVEQIVEDSDRNKWMTSDEAKDYGLIDHVMRRNGKE